MRSIPRQPLSGFDWSLYFQWIMATTIGWLVSTLLFGAMSFLIVGFSVGFFQWLVLIKHLDHSWRWIVATGLGWTVGYILSYFFLPLELDLFTGFLTGLSAGIAQWLILRRQVALSFWWLVISPLAWFAGMTLLPGIFLTGIIAGVISGIALISLLQFPQPISALESDPSS